MTSSAARRALRRRSQHSALRRRSLIRVIPATAAVLTAGAVLAGCSSTPGSNAAGQSPANSSRSAPTSPGDPGASGLPAGVSAAAADALCSDLDGQLQSMRTYTITPGKVTLNGVVMTWAAENGVDLVDLARHRDKIDRILEAQCPDVRDGATSALEIPDVASALVGF
ncbi:MAG: hypothetical protein L0H59_10520 [Tomitella sp.]|nr:hypothetical protein [Tomitella sp.]